MNSYKSQKLEHIQDQLHHRNIQVHNFAISQTKKAVCLDDSGYKYIALNKPALESPAEELVILAEEFGHFETGALYAITATSNTAVARSNRIKFEGRALHWAYRSLLPPAEIEHAVRLCATPWDAAEHCQVTEEFLQNAIKYHRDCGVQFGFDQL